MEGLRRAASGSRALHWLRNRMSLHTNWVKTQQKGVSRGQGANAAHDKLTQ